VSAAAEIARAGADRLELLGLRRLLLLFARPSRSCAIASDRASAWAARPDMS
jgi:hypothetical protein